MDAVRFELEGGEPESDRLESHDAGERELLERGELLLLKDGQVSFDDPSIHDTSTPETLLFKNDLLMVIVNPRANTH